MKNVIDINQIAEQLDPWDFSCKIDGISYPTREMTLADMIQFEAMENMPAAEFSAFVHGLFEEPQPKLKGKKSSALVAIVTGVMVYVKARATKNSPRVGAAVAAALMESSPSQKSSA